MSALENPRLCPVTLSVAASLSRKSDFIHPSGYHLLHPTFPQSFGLGWGLTSCHSRGSSVFLIWTVDRPWTLESRAQLFPLLTYTPVPTLLSSSLLWSPASHQTVDFPQCTTSLPSCLHSTSKWANFKEATSSAQNTFFVLLFAYFLFINMF